MSLPVRDMDDLQKKRAIKPVPMALDGGWGWVILLGCFGAYFIADGFSYSIGVLFPYLVYHFMESRGKTAVIGAMLYGVPLLISPLVCASVNLYGCRKVTVVGGFLTGLSLIISTFANSVAYLYITIGFFSSVGLAMTYVPSLMIVTYYFEKRRGLATGLAVTGSGLGAFLFPLLLEYMIKHYSWHGGLLITGAVVFNIIPFGGLYRAPPVQYISDVSQNSSFAKKYHLKKMADDSLVPRLYQNEEQRRISRSVCALNIPEENINHESSISLGKIQAAYTKDPQFENDKLLLPKSIVITRFVSSPDISPSFTNETAENTDIQEQEINASMPRRLWLEVRSVVSEILDKSLIYNVAYILFCIANIVLYAWVGIPMLYIADKVLNLGASDSKAALAVSLIGIGRTLGQIGLGALGDINKISVIFLYGISIVICGLGTLLVPLLTTYDMIYFYAFVFGCFISVTYVIQMMCIVNLVGLDKITSAFGILQLGQGVATLVGTSLPGWIFDATGSYDTAFYTAGAWILTSGLVMISLPLVSRKTRQRKDPSGTSA